MILRQILRHNNSLKQAKVAELCFISVFMELLIKYRAKHFVLFHNTGEHRFTFYLRI